MSERRQRQDIRVFLSSPGDVAEERRLARELIEGALRKDAVFGDRLSIEYVAWDDAEAPTPMLATEVPQASVNAAKPPPSECDIVVVVLWSRLGSPFELNGRRWASGTEWEYEDAAAAPGKPDILVYRRTAKPPHDDIDFRHPEVAAKLAKKQAQYQALEEFLGRIKGHTEYADPAEFGRRLEQDLRQRLARHLPRSEDPVRPASPFASDVLARFGVAQAAPPAFRAGAEQFIASYLGTAERPVPFGGRGPMLERLDRWLDDPASPRRLLLHAPGGRGKSALVVHWLERAAERCHPIFLPVSVRFSTNRAELFYHGLAARLAELLGAELRAPTADPVEHYKGFAIDLLRRADELEKPVLLAADGLDEMAGWQLDPALLPHEPAPKLRVLVSAREQAGDNGGEGWLGRLRWDRLGPAPEAIEVAPLDVTGISDVLTRMSDALVDLAGNPEVRAQLARLTGGDPLLVRLYAEDLEQRGAGTGRLRPEDLAELKPGFGPFFRDWLVDQEVLWEAGGRAIDRDTVDLILSLLACALGPLRHADLADLCRCRRGEAFVLPRRAMEALGRFVLGDGAKQGYVLAHPKLADHLRQDYFADPAIVEAARAAFIEWGRDALARLNAGKLRPEGCPSYLLMYLGQHLKEAGAMPADFMSLVEEGWLHAWEAFEGGYRGFSQDVRRAADAAARLGTGCGPHWAWRLRCQLVLGSIASIGSQVPGELLARCVENGLLSPRQALHWLEYQTDWSRAKAMDALVPHLPEAVLAEALQAATAIRDQWSRAKIR